jgi:hypothetical protein
MQDSLRGIARTGGGQSFVLAVGVLISTFTAAAAQEQHGQPLSLPGPVAAAEVPPPGPASPAVEEVVEVEVGGEGLSREQAVRAALRAALEAGGRQEIFSDTQVENFQLMRDTIISRAEGIVTDYRVIDEREGAGGTVRVRIRARVSKQVLVDSWGAIQNVLNQIGRPRIMVYIAEKIDGRPEEQGILETEIEKRLLGSGFELVERTAVASIREKELADAAAREDVQRLQAVAKDFDAHIFITGTANADKAGLEQVYGVPIAFYNCDVQLKAYYTDNARLLASAGIPATRGGARGRREFSPQAGKMALSLAGRSVVEDVYQQVMRQWATQISAGGELVLEVRDVRFKAANDLRRGIEQIEGVNNVQFKLTHGIATYQINATLSAHDLAEMLSEGEFAGLIEIDDLKLNRIQAHAGGS